MQRCSVIPILDRLGALQPRARAWICDIWGVIHNGAEAFPAAVEACVSFRAGGGRIILVSNAPRPSDGVVAQLGALGVPRSAYDAVLTSGDVARAMLRGWRGVPTLHIGPERDLTLFKGLGVPLVGPPEAARVLCSGLTDDTVETPETYRQMLGALAVRHLPMLCANPDIKVDRGGKIIYCGGAIAALYAELGGRVEYAGKPYPAIYATARAMLKEMTGQDIALTDVMAIGDGVHTDIAGGISAGMRSIYIASPIHAQGALTIAALDRLFPVEALRPTAAMDALAW